jgi:hypothetical protein
MSRKLGGFTLSCRFICSALVAFPLLHFYITVAEGGGDVYHFLALVLLAPIAGLVLIANSLFCLFRYRNTKSSLISFVFILVGVIGFLVAWHFLPQFKM